MAVGQGGALLLSVYGLGLPVRVEAVAVLVTVGALANGALALWLRRGRPSSPARSLALVAAVLVLDVVLLTGMLALSGGAHNPFSVVYVAHVALAALLLGVRGAWGLALLTSAGFGLLFFVPCHGGGPASLHLQGMWVAYTVTALVVGHFTAKLAHALRLRETQVRVLERVAAKTEKLASLTTLAAGAAHELGTPLATIALAAGELGHELAARGGDHGALAEDARLIRAEVERCRHILERMATQAGESTGEMPEEVTAARILDDVRAELGPSAVSVDLQADDGTFAFTPPRRTLVQVLVNLLRNGLDAQREAGRDEPVVLRVASCEGELRFAVRDRGRGIDPEILARVGEPFFTTKAPGRGLGLGVFLARTFAERLGGRLIVESRDGAGTEAVLVLPRSVL